MLRLVATVITALAFFQSYAALAFFPKGLFHSYLMLDSSLQLPTLLPAFGQFQFVESIQRYSRLRLTGLLDDPEIHSTKNLLFLSDGINARGSMYYSQNFPLANITSTELNIPLNESLPANIHRVSNDNTKPFVDFGVQYNGIVLDRGLCNHQLWQDTSGKRYSNIGCAGIPLTQEGISTLISQVALLLDGGGVFLLGGAASSKENQLRKTKYGLPSILSEDTRQAIAAGVERFNTVQNTMAVEMLTNANDVLLVGEMPVNASFSYDELEVLEYRVRDYFSVDRDIFSISFEDDLVMNSWETY